MAEPTEPPPRGQPQILREAASVGALVAVAPGAGYVVSWVHEYGYVQAFGVPLDLIAPQLSNVLLAAFLLVAAGGGVFLAVDWYLARRQPGSPVSAIEWQVAGFLIVAVVVAGVELVPLPLIARIAFASLLALSGLQIFVLPVLGHRGTYRQRMEAARAATVRRDSLIDRLDQRYLWAIFIGVVALVVSVWIGIVQAAYETNYLVTTSGTPELVVRIYGDTVILADYDAAAHQVRRRYHVLKLGNQQTLNVEDRPLGHLSLSG